MAHFDTTIVRPHFILKIWVPQECSELKEYYVQAKNKHNNAVNPVISGANATFDAGFDLICPENITVPAQKTIKINHKIRCSMSRTNGGALGGSQHSPEYSVGYYLYPRSSTGTKTPLRLSNSVGIIDSGYRGDIIAAVDNWSSNDYVVETSHRIVQLCPPDLSHPLVVTLVDTLEELGETPRGVGGFGSTGM